MITGILGSGSAHLWWYWHPDYVCWSALSRCTSQLRDFIADYTQDHVSQWVEVRSHLSSFAATQPLCCICCSCLWFFVQIELLHLLTTPNINDLLSPRACHSSNVSAHHDTPSSQWYRARIVQPSHISWWPWDLWSLLHFREELYVFMSCLVLGLI